MKLALAQFETATCMTDKLEAIRSILSFGGVSFKEHRIQAIESFYREAHADALMLNKWFSIQASADVDNVIDEVNICFKLADFLFFLSNSFFYDN